MIKDSGQRTEFGTGAVRDMKEGKGRCDLLPLDIIATFFDGSYKTQEYELWSPYVSETALIMEYIAKFQQTNDVKYLYYALYFFASHAFENKYDMILQLSKHFEEGAKKYGENNWQRGIPAWSYLDSAVRHYLKHLYFKSTGEEPDEPHDRAFVWNIICLIWTRDHIDEITVAPSKV